MSCNVRNLLLMARIATKINAVVQPNIMIPFAASNAASSAAAAEWRESRHPDTGELIFELGTTASGTVARFPGAAEFEISADGATVTLGQATASLEHQRHLLLDHVLPI